MNWAVRNRYKLYIFKQSIDPVSSPYYLLAHMLILSVSIDLQLLIGLVDAGGLLT